MSMSWAEASQGAIVVLSRQDAIHFLRRVGFTAPESKISEYEGLTRAAAVDKALDFTNSPALNPPAIVNDPHEQWRGFTELTGWWYRRMMTTPTPLEEKMALFWHDHFACSQEKVYDIKAMYDQQKIFRNRGFGDFETLLWEVSISGAMLSYIDNETNVKGAVQENFGRELMELHTVGVGEYTEADVVAMSRAWTGHNTIGWNGSYHDHTYKFYPDRHDYGQKRLFGISRDWDARDTVTELVNGSKQQATARYIARKMWKWFAHPNPSDSLVNSLASTFIGSGMNCEALLRAILSHPGFWGSASRNALVRNPVELAVAFFEATGLEVLPATNDNSKISGESVWWYTLPLGMTLFKPPNVAGWGENEYWISTATSWGRAEFFGDFRWMLTDPARGHNLFDGLRDMNAGPAVDHLFDTFEIYNPTNATREHLESWFNGLKNSNHSWAVATEAIRLVPMFPDFQVI